MSDNWFERTDLAADYAKFRPHYDPTMYKEIVNFCKQQKGFETKVALDVGCGSGQGTFQLAELFDKTHGVDISEAQINWAKKNNKHDNVEFRASPAEDLSFFESGTVDLILAGTAIHWFDKEKFYEEARRVLKPTGHIAVYLYSVGFLNDDIGRHMAKKFFQEILQAEELCMNRFGNFMVTQSGLELPFEDVTEIPNQTTNETRTLKSYVDFLATTSDFNCSIGKIWTREEAMEKKNNFQKQLDEMYKDWKPRTKDTDEPIVNISFPIYLKVGRKTSINN